MRSKGRPERRQALPGMLFVRVTPRRTRARWDPAAGGWRKEDSAMSSWHVRAVVWKWPEAGVVDELGAEFLGGGAMVEPGKCGGSGHAKERIYLSIADAPTKIRSGRPYSTPSDSYRP
jgi:hypothetical protein